ncbi:MAG: FimV/HubP family polar landmark protein, partial [Thiohalocapsa sp.]
ATVAQTAMALYRNNPDAFVRGQINLLKVRSELYIPTADELFALDADAAEQQLQDAMAGRTVTSKPITDVPEQPQLKIAAARADADTVAADGDAPESEPAASRQETGVDIGAPPEKIGDLEEDLLLVREASESNRQEATELRDRIRELEGQLTDIRRLLELRNDQLAQLQLTVQDPAGAEAIELDLRDSEALETAAAAIAVAAELAPTGSIENDDTGSDTASGSGSDGPLDPGRELLPRPMAEVIDTTPNQAPSTVAQDPPSEAAAPKVLPGVPSALSPDAETASQRPESDAAQEAVTATASTELELGPSGSGPFGFMSTMLDGVPLWAAGSGAGAIALGGFGLLAYRRRRQHAETEPVGNSLNLGAPRSEAAATPSEQMVDEELSIDLDLLSEPVPGVVQPADVGAPGSVVGIEAGPRTNDAPSDLQDAWPETEETDILAEADIYIQYGRYREAEGILLDELGHSPARADLKFKLAESYLGSGNRDALATLMDEMKTVGEHQRDAKQWAAIEQGLAAMNPGSVRSASGVSTSASVRTGPSRVAPLAPFAAPRGVETGTRRAPREADAEDGDGRTSEAWAQEVSPSGGDGFGDELEDLELDLEDLDAIGDLGSKLGSLSDDPQTGSSSSSSPDASELKVSTGLASGTGEFRDGAIQTVSDERLDLDLDGLGELANLDDVLRSSPHSDSSVSDADDPSAFGPLPEPSNVKNSVVQGSDGLELKDVDTANGGEPLSDGSSTFPLSSEWPMETGIWDETATKMDLARAYVDMEDPDAARSILEEVVQDGDDTQQAEAKALLSKIA